jgi:branched-subunit amino acid ABC-type transport system permease component
VIVLGLEFHSVILLPAIVNGIAIASLYGVMTIALVMTYRMSRTVAFVNGGIGTFAAFLYWWLAQDPNKIFGVPVGLAYSTRNWPDGLAFATVVVLGAVVGGIFGSVLIGRMAGWPRETTTTFALGAMLLLMGVAGSLWKGVFERVPSIFGDGKFVIGGTPVRWHQVASVIILVTLVGSLVYVLERTRAGTYIRAIADDPEIAAIVGIDVKRLTLLTWSFTGGLAAFAGAMIVPMTLLTELSVTFVLLRSLAAAVLGGFDSLWLGLGGAMVFGLVESIVGSGVFGPMSSGAREVLLIVILFLGIGAVSWKKRSSSVVGLLEG